MNKNCQYVFKIGKKKRSQCNNRCKETYCCRHNPLNILNNVKRKREYRENEEYREKKREYIKNKRKDPKYRKKKFNYKLNYCKKNNISLDDLYDKIHNKTDIKQIVKCDIYGENYDINVSKKDITNKNQDSYLYFKVLI